jgi:hypothetical protein
MLHKLAIFLKPSRLKVHLQIEGPSTHIYLHLVPVLVGHRLVGVDSTVVVVGIDGFLALYGIII